MQSHKNIADKHEALINETKVTMNNLRDDICIMQSDYDQKLKNINFKSVSINNSPPPNTKWKLSNVKSTNTKALDCYLKNIKLAGD